MAFDTQLEWASSLEDKRLCLGPFLASSSNLFLKTLDDISMVGNRKVVTVKLLNDTLLVMNW